MRRAGVAAMLAGAALGLLLLVPAPTIAKDHGVAGQVFPIIEPDLLAVIEARLRRLDHAGEIKRANAMFAKRAERRIRRPAPVAGITPAVEGRRWAFDPAVTIDRDVRDAKGNLIAKRGERINPLDFVPIRQSLVFVRGDSDDEMAWATTRYRDTEAKIILVDGSPIEQMTARKRRFYFDQGGRLSARLGVRHTPAVATPDGGTLTVSEIVLKKPRVS